MKKLIAFVMAAMLLAPVAARADVAIGQPAPDFAATTADGGTLKLADLKGKVVVLEWSNGSCPFVKKHYDSNNMQALQKEMAAKGAVWVQVLSSAPGKQGHVDGTTAAKLNAERGAAPTHVVLDPAGELGRLYLAKVTPHMFVIDAEGKLAYMGAIDDNASANPADVAGAHSYVRAAVEALLAGKPVTAPNTKAYGCGIKYS